MDALTPEQIVEALDKYIVGQTEAKRKVAIALRNRWRRQQLPEDMRDEVAPKNIIMIGPTGVGKTEIARRLAKLADAPFVKVEASKFTEVGYVGRDCESMIRELTAVAISLIQQEKEKALKDKARENAERRLLDLLLPPGPQRIARGYHPFDPQAGDEQPAASKTEDAEERTRNIIGDKLAKGELEDREIEIDVRDGSHPSMMQIFTNSGLEEMGVNLQEMFGKMMPQQTRKRRLTVKEARDILEQEELQNLLDMDAIVKEAIERTENSGIVFLDEIDKIASSGRSQHGPDVSREGVQRDILPIVEGSTVQTKYGPVRTDHVLFIAAGAFHSAKVSDLIPELQGRFPIRVELKSLNAEDFSRILREPRNSLVKQYKALLETEGIKLEITEDAVEAIARNCQHINEESENIGARRLHTLMEYLLEDLLFEAPQKSEKHVVLDGKDVEERLKPIVKSPDLSKYIL